MAPICVSAERVDREDRAEEHVQQIDVRAAQRDDQDTQRKRCQIEAGEARILLQHGRTTDGPRQQRHGETRPRAHQCPLPSATASRRRDSRLRHPAGWRGSCASPDQAHPPQHQEDTDRPRSEAQAQAGDKRPAHEAIVGERREEADRRPLMQPARRRLRLHPSVRPWRGPSAGSAATSRRPLAPIRSVPRAISSVCGKCARICSKS